MRAICSPLAFAQGQLLLPDLRAQYAGRTVQGKLWLDTRPETPEMRLYAVARQLPLQRIPALREQRLDGAADLALLAYGRTDAPTIEANLRMDALRYADQRVGGLRACSMRTARSPSRWRPCRARRTGAGFGRNP